MNTILQVNKEDLRAELKSVMLEVIEEIKGIPAPPPPAPQPDRIYFKEALQVADQSESQMYKLTMLNEIPFKKYGKKLVFSRKELLKWMEDRTKNPLPPDEIMSRRLATSAKKQLKK